MSLNNSAVCLIPGRPAFCLLPRLTLWWLLLLASISPVLASELVAIDSDVSAQQTHSFWITPGELVTFRLPDKPDCDSVNREADTCDESIVFSRSMPDTAQLLDNPNGSRSFFWIPQAQDIGSRQVEFLYLDRSGSTELLNIALQLHVLEATFGGGRLNSLPDLTITGSTGNAIPKDGLLEIVKGEMVSLQLLAKDSDKSHPDLHAIDLPSKAIFKLASKREQLESQSPIHASEGENRNRSRGYSNSDGKSDGKSAVNILWNTDAVLNGYSNFTVYAVDKDYPLEFVSHTVNVLVEKAVDQRPSIHSAPTSVIKLSKSGQSHRAEQTPSRKNRPTRPSEQSRFEWAKTVTLTLSSVAAAN